MLTTMPKTVKAATFTAAILGCAMALTSCSDPSTAKDPMPVSTGTNGDSAQDFWKFVDTAISQMPLTRDTTAKLIGETLEPATLTDERYESRAGNVGAVQFDSVLVANSPTTKKWVRTRFTVSAASQPCASNIADTIKSKYTITGEALGSFDGPDPTVAYYANINGGVADFYVSKKTGCITTVALATKR